MSPGSILKTDSKRPSRPSRGASIKNEVEKNGGKFDWINCGLCADERGVNDAVEGVRRGSPADLLKLASESDNTLVIGTR